MKRTIGFLLLLFLTLTLVACGGQAEPQALTPATEPIPTPAPVQAPIHWRSVYLVDDFGDRTGMMAITGTFAGEFSNTAVDSAVLEVVVQIPIRANGWLYSSFRLYEYGRTIATFLSRDEDNITMRTRADGNDNEFRMTGNAPNSPLFISCASNFDTFMDYLLHGQEISCIIDIGSSRYRFTIDATGFAELYAELWEEKEQRLAVFQENFNNQATTMIVVRSAIFHRLSTEAVERLESERPGFQAFPVFVIECEILGQGTVGLVFLDETTLAGFAVRGGVFRFAGNTMASLGFGHIVLSGGELSFIDDLRLGLIKAEQSTATGSYIPVGDSFLRDVVFEIVNPVVVEP